MLRKLQFSEDMRPHGAEVNCNCKLLLTEWIGTFRTMPKGLLKWNAVFQQVNNKHWVQDHWTWTKIEKLRSDHISSRNPPFWPKAYKHLWYAHIDAFSYLAWLDLLSGLCGLVQIVLDWPLSHWPIKYCWIFSPADILTCRSAAGKAQKCYKDNTRTLRLKQLNEFSCHSLYYFLWKRPILFSLTINLTSGNKWKTHVLCRCPI